MKHLGDFDLSAVIYAMFTTYSPSTGAPSALGGGSGPALAVYKDGSAAQSSAGVTLTVSFDGIAGLNHVAIDTSADGTFYSAGGHFEIVILNGTVGGVEIVGSCVASFDLRKDSSLKPTTAGRTLDVSAGGEAGLDWANIGSPTTVQNLSATNIDVDQVVASVSGAVGSLTGLTVTDVAAIKAKTDNLPTDPADESLIIAATDAIMARLGAPAGASVSADVAAVLASVALRLLTSAYTAPLDAAGTRAAVGLAAANLDTQIGTLATAAALATTDGKVDAVKAKTDSLTFTVAGQVDANVQYVNDVQITGNGAPGTEWGPV